MVSFLIHNLLSNKRAILNLQGCKDEEGSDTFNYLYNTSYIKERTSSICECIKDLRAEFKAGCPNFIKTCKMYEHFWTTYRFTKNMNDLIEDL
jgi:hypothetical protein